MIFSSRSIEFKVALGLLWAFPYVVLFIRAPKWEPFLRNPFGSGFALLLFATSFLLLGLLGTDFHFREQVYYPPEQLFRLAVSKVIFLFPGLPLVLLFTAFTAAVKPQCPNNLPLYLLSALSHGFYCFNVIVIAFDLWGR